MADGSQSVGALHYDLDIDDGKLESSLDRADGKIEDFGKTVENNGERIKANMQKTAAVLAVAAVGLTAFSKSATDFTVDYVKSSKALGREIGVSTEEASRLTAAFKRMGIESESAQQMFGIFAKKIVASTEATTTNRLQTDKLNISIEQTQRKIKETSAEIAKNGDKSGDLNMKLKELNNTLASQKQALNESTDSFQKLGVSTTDAQGKQKDFNTILFEVADKFKAMPDGLDKTALSMDLFGRSGKDMIKVLNLGSDGIKELEAQADKLGLTLTADTIGKVNDLVESQKKLKEQTDALKIAVGTATAPVLTEFNTRVNGMVQALLNMDGPIKTATANVLAFGGPVLGAASTALGLGANLATIAPSAGAAAASIGGYAVAAAAGVGAAALFGHELTKVQEQMHLNVFETTAMQVGISSMIPGFGTLAVTFNQVENALFGNNTQTQQLKVAQDQLKVSTDALKGAQDLLKDTQLNQQQATIAVETATRNYDQAVRQNGAGSLEARQAAVNLEVAKRSLEKSNNAVAEAEKNHTNKANENAGAMAHSADVAADASRKVASNAGLWDRAASSIGNFAKKLGEVVWNYETGKSFGLKIPGFAKGVEDFGGGLAYVHGGEVLANLPKGTDVIPKNQVSNVFGGNTVRGGDTNISIGVIQDRQDADYILNQIDRMSALESMGISPARTVMET